MRTYDLRNHLGEFYNNYPEGRQQPVIGITTNYVERDARLADRYYMSVIEAGGTPVLIPPVADRDVIVNTLENIDGLLLTGGADINPLWAGEEPSANLSNINSTRDLPELLATRLAYNRHIPILGICRGIQTLAVALDGKVQQHVVSEIKHSQDAPREELTHSVTIEPGTLLYRIFGERKRILVNSIHHQAVAAPGRRFSVSAHAADGVIEAIESVEYKPVLGVQWHPEWLPEGAPLFEWLVDEAGKFRMAKQLHCRVLTLDTHCDTPMFFHKGVDFGHRDPEILCDLHKMTEGRQDAVIMAAYLPQPKMGEMFSQKVAFDVDGPTKYADLIFDKIEEIVRKNRQYLSIARTAADLYEDKRKGRKSIMFGIENGLALGHNLQNVRHFAQRGVVYITLCHNGDNDICDSAKGCNTHGGLSKFGRDVIREMNDCGLMVDLSHAGEKTFYDAVELSRMPVVCSHSNCRALCDHPRNLTDDQLRAIAGKGGVVQITLYPGFLRTQGEATIADVIRHLEHAIEIAGIDHVGIGTDFDGDGGVRGMADSSEMINFTRQLMERNYSERDIQKIWGGNWIRVMAQVQSAATKK
ncbi:membrane dipeptidase [Prevotella sp. OH937_COT-195]|uniref:membrane dipeptidase n=1 Tax=Prevotella sp. OH937_COT-195 TaxID=2491051 RepID=UPI000F6495D5|nr:membrane dipeptidase [Prevotella sp. OH937_COT-195]RRD00933.1 fused gamma-glutamyl-gamma-aminobutyrate hydrolase/peptidase [Prevotella sp. OH937_COT-195]